jgi:hypothetical protein
LAANYQEDLAAHFRSPFSVAAGLSYRFGGRQRGAIHFTAEYFGRQKEFDVLAPDPFRAQTTGDLIDREFTHEAEPVFNWGGGGEFRPRKTLAFYAAFITDYSYRPDGVDPLREISVSNWDIRHVSFGSAFTVKDLDFTVGLSYGWGRDTPDRPVDFTDAGQANHLRGVPARKDVSYNSLKLLVGFSFPL